ncbi:MAG: ECF-type sigma factor [Acidobacteriota bacterium]
MCGGTERRPAKDELKSAITDLLQQWNAGDDQAAEEVLSAVYQELKKIAVNAMWGERGHETLQPTALVHEAYLRLARQSRVHWLSRTHFLSVAAIIMRRILVDLARRRGHRERYAAAERSIRVEGEAPDTLQAEDVLSLDAALLRLAQRDSRKARVVELRFFGGLSVPETAEILGCSTATVVRDWALARAWLYRQIQRGPSGAD